MNEHEEAVKAARTIVNYCKGRKCEGGCVFWNKNTCLIRWLADFNWCSHPEMTFLQVLKRLEELEAQPQMVRKAIKVKHLFGWYNMSEENARQYARHLFRTMVNISNAEERVKQINEKHFRGIRFTLEELQK